TSLIDRSTDMVFAPNAYSVTAGRSLRFTPRRAAPSSAARFFERVNDARRRMAVPEFGHAPARRRTRERREGFAPDDFRVVADDAVSAFADGHRALGVAAQGQAGDAERGRLFLYAAAV